MVKFQLYSFFRGKNSFIFQYDLVGETDRRGDRDPKKRATDIIGRLDVGGDKKLSKHEFIAGYVLLDYLTLIYLIVLLLLDAKTIQLFVEYLPRMLKYI